MSPTSAIKLWGHPTSRADITSLFISHISGTLSAIPWSEEGLNEETNTIKSHLLALNQKGWWTVASQPAIDGLKSSDSTFGWGPKNGFVFQKAFVELFVPKEDLEALLTKMRADDTKELVSFYASNSKGEFLSSDDGAGGSTNAVTWGSFPGKEIITPTIIEEVSFRAWAEEAFGIWSEWSRVYTGVGEEKKKSREVIEGMADQVWLVNVIHHGYHEKEGLWELLLN
jgi:methylenetetrahydrofolate reductase (NADPH)